MQKSNPDVTHVEKLLDLGRSTRVHWYSEEVSVGAIAETLTAMANTDGGEVLFGVSSRAGEIQGLYQTDLMIDKIFQAALRVEPTLVLPVPQKTKINQKEVLWLLVPAGLPHAYSLDGRYLGRENAHNTPISAPKLHQLLIERGVVSLESRLVANADFSDFDPAQLHQYLMKLDLPLDSSLEDLMVKRSCAKLVEGKLSPTYAGLLLFGKDPQQWLPSASILAVRVPGPVFQDQFVKQEIRGPLPEQLRQAAQFVLDHISQEVNLAGLEHQRVTEYPLEVVRELLVNAVAHRDYNLQGDSIHLNIFSDRIEVHSPGTLPGPVNLSNLLQARFSRNPVIMQVLSDLGFGERIGYGLDRVVAVLREQGLPPPEFEEVAGTFRVTVRRQTSRGFPQRLPEPFRFLDLNDRQQILLSYLLANPRVTNRDYQELCPEVHPETLRRDLVDLVQRGLLIKIGDKRATYYVLKHRPSGRR